MPAGLADRARRPRPYAGRERAMRATKGGDQTVARDDDRNGHPGAGTSPAAALPVAVSGTGKDDGEATALAWSAFHLQPPAVSLHQVVGDGQAKSQTLPESAGLAPPVEWVKHVRLVLGQNAGAGINHSDAHGLARRAGLN